MVHHKLSFPSARDPNVVSHSLSIWDDGVLLRGIRGISTIDPQNSSRAFGADISANLRAEMIRKDSNVVAYSPASGQDLYLFFKINQDSGCLR